jgi:hypothetical protein
MPVKMQPTSEIKAHLGIDPNGRVQKKFQSLCYRYMDDYVPLDRGDLAYRQVDLSDPTKIVYNSPYAHYMYVGKVMGPNIPKKDENGNLIGWFSKKGQKKYYTGKDINYEKSVARGHKNAGPYWDERMVSAEMGDLVKDLQAYIDRGA